MDTPSRTSTLLSWRHRLQARTLPGSRPEPSQWSLGPTPGNYKGFTCRPHGESRPSCATRGAQGELESRSPAHSEPRPLQVEASSSKGLAPPRHLCWGLLGTGGGLKTFYSDSVLNPCPSPASPTPQPLCSDPALPSTGCIWAPSWGEAEYCRSWCLLPVLTLAYRLTVSTWGLSG